MKTITALAANKLGKFLAKDFRRVFGPAHDDVAERLASLARSTIECLGRSDALYHNFEHTLQVTMVGRDILRGMTLSQRIEPADYDHLIVACLLHDIGYMRGVLNGDTETEFVVDGKGKKITLPRGASDAALAPYHVDRSKLFAFERLGKSPTIDAAQQTASSRATVLARRGSYVSQKQKCASSRSSCQRRSIYALWLHPTLFRDAQRLCPGHRRIHVPRRCDGQSGQGGDRQPSLSIVAFRDHRPNCRTRQQACAGLSRCKSYGYTVVVPRRF